MSRETLESLNSQTLIGFTDKRGHAWHYREDLQGDESNHYTGPVPVEDVRRRLFNWQAVEGTITATAITDDGVITHEDKDRKAIMRSDTGGILGVFRKQYTIHQFDEWLLNQVANLIDDDLQIGSAGLLKGGAVAWVSIEVPDTLRTPEGVEFRPFLLACTSHDGSLATTYHRHVQSVVCDNTMSIALAEPGQKIKVKHTANSVLKLADAREALHIVFDIADAFNAQVSKLTSMKVSDRDWVRFLDKIAPLTDRDGEPLPEGKALTMAINRRDELTRLYAHDERAAPWRGTAWGVVAAVNTWAHHHQTVRRSTRSARNMLRAVTGQVDALDMSTMRTLESILA